jgi:hypothetical protein
LREEGDAALDMFSYILNDPVGNFRDFVKLLIVLCGKNKDTSKGIKVMNLLKIKDVRPPHEQE